MVRGRKDPSSAAVSAASMKGNAGPKQKYGGGKRTSQNQQYKKTTWNNIACFWADRYF
ncbi:YuzL family protein [Bacillus velezensis]|nr:YuzL family protein [Bacillus velezensis]